MGYSHDNAASKEALDMELILILEVNIVSILLVVVVFVTLIVFSVGKRTIL